MGLENQNPHTTNSLPVPLPSQNRSTPDPQKLQTIAAKLAELATIYHRADFSEAQAQILIKTYVSDLAEFAIVDIEDAIRTYRRNPKSKFFPLVGELIELAQKAAAGRRSVPGGPRMVPEFGEPRPILWWLRRRKVWEPHWKESEIPANEREPYFRWKAAQEAKGLA